MRKLNPVFYQALTLAAVAYVVLVLSNTLFPGSLFFFQDAAQITGGIFLVLILFVISAIVLHVAKALCRDLSSRMEKNRSKDD